MAAERYLNSLSSIISIGQIFGIMPVQRYRRHRQGGGWINHQTTTFLAMDGDSTGAVAASKAVVDPVPLTVFNLHDTRLFAQDSDSNTIASKEVNVRDGGKKNAFRGRPSKRRENNGEPNDRENRGTLYYVTQFNWKHPRTVFSLLLIALGTAEWLSTIHELVKFGASMGSIGAFNFYSITYFGLITFFCLGRKWPGLYAFWTNTAQVFDELPYRQRRRNSRISSGVKIRAMFRIWMSIALVETTMYRLVSVMDIAKQKRVCNLSENLWEMLYLSWRPHIYHIIDFEFWHIPFLEILNISLTVTWTYLDVFIMMISLGIQDLYEAFNGRMERTEDKKMPYSFWIEMRTHYVILNNLVAFIDEHLAVLIVISFGSNLYFICLQVFNSFNLTYKSWLHVIYFYASMMMVIVRAMAVIKCAAGIEMSAKKSKKVLRQIPTDRWNDELQRLNDMMSHDLVALSGCRFFHLTKTLFLAMMGTVATYEFVILDLIELQTSGEESGVICSNPA